MEFADIKNKSEKDLHELLAEKREEARELKFKSSEGQLKNVRALRVVRKTIARIFTLLNSKAKQS